MNIKDFLFLIFFFAISTILKAESNDEVLPEIISSDIPECEIVRKDYYDKKTLWGYIDGGADIYLEYGFDKLMVEEINWVNEHFKVEVYKMKNPLAAFGIYSISNANCSATDSLTEYSCITAYQTVAYSNNFFISIINDNGTETAKKLSCTIGKILLGKIGYEIFKLPAILALPEFIQHKKEIKYFSGKLGLQNSLPEMADQFESFNNYSVYFLPVELKEGYINLYIISFSNNKDLSEFYSLQGIKYEDSNSEQHYEKNGIHKNIMRLKPGEIIFIETTLTAEVRDSYIHSINHYIKQYD